MNDSLSTRLSSLAPLVVRLALGLVLLWFSVNQLMNPGPWANIVPDYATTITGMSAVNVVLANGVFELLLAIVLLLGIFPRWAGLIASLHLLQIALMLGYNAIGVRDFGLAVSAFAIFLYGSDGYSIERLLKRK